MEILLSDTKFIILVISSTLTPSCRYSSGIKVLSALDLLALPLSLLRSPFLRGYKEKIYCLKSGVKLLKK